VAHVNDKKEAKLNATNNNVSSRCWGETCCTVFWSD